MIHILKKTRIKKYKKKKASDKKNAQKKDEDVLKRTPRKVEMLTADDDEDQN